MANKPKVNGEGGQEKGTERSSQLQPNSLKVR